MRKIGALVSSMLCLFVPRAAAEDPIITIVPGEGVTWKSIFDAGFRPKHQPGLERRNTLWFGPSFGTRVGDDGAVFSLGPGRLLIEVQTDATVRYIWHQSSERITFEEGESRAAAFREAFAPYVIQELKMPTRSWPGGPVEAGEAWHNVKARVGEWVIWYGFDSSFDVERPLVPHLYISHNFPGQKLPRVATMEDRVKPPPGYEWYSLEPETGPPAQDGDGDAGFGSEPAMKSDTGVAKWVSRWLIMSAWALLLAFLFCVWRSFRGWRKR